jgi:midasin (ATPase involved in ribosome maturation)
MPAKVRNNIIAAFVDFMNSHTNIHKFNPTFINNNGIMETAVKNILSGNNLALTGPKGVGKNVLVDHLSNLFDLPLCDMQMSYDTAKEEVRGEPTFMEDGSIGVRLSNIVDAAQKPSLINLDEVNMARGSITSLLHSLTDHRRYIEIPGYGMVNVHPQARFTITMNEGDEYEGTRQLNAAFRDRFHEIVFKNNPEAMKAVFMSTCQLNDEDASALTKFYKLIYSAVYNTDSDAAIPADYLSQRKFVRAGQIYSKGFALTIKDAFREEVIDTIPDEEIKGILENLILINC